MIEKVTWSPDILKLRKKDVFCKTRMLKNAMEIESICVYGSDEPVQLHINDEGYNPCFFIN